VPDDGCVARNVAENRTHKATKLRVSKLKIDSKTFSTSCTDDGNENMEQYSATGC
jgi:hypothetical protein